MDELYKIVRAFIDAHGLPEPTYVTLSKGGHVSMHIHAPAATLGLDVEWSPLGDHPDTMSARTRFAGVAVSVIAVDSKAVTV